MHTKTSTSKSRQEQENKEPKYHLLLQHHHQFSQSKMPRVIGEITKILYEKCRNKFFDS